MEACPYHNTEPAVKKLVARNKIDETYVDGNGQKRRYALPELVVYRVFCPSCANPPPGRRLPSRFGKGYSAKTLDAAERKWNDACAGERLKIFKNAVKTGD